MSHPGGQGENSGVTEDLTIYRRYLPHWEAGGSTYFLTFRLHGTHFKAEHNPSGVGSRRALASGNPRSHARGVPCCFGTSEPGTRIEVGGYRDEEEKWPAIQDAMRDAMVRLEKALRPHRQAEGLAFIRRLCGCQVVS
jgi:hypothetical protein